MTLLMFVGFCQSPAAAGNGGLKRGVERFPSIASIMAVSSPATYESPVSETSASNEKSLSRMLVPSKPISYAWSMASLVASIGRSCPCLMNTTPCVDRVA